MRFAETRYGWDEDNPLSGAAAARKDVAAMASAP